MFFAIFETCLAVNQQKFTINWDKRKFVRQFFRILSNSNVSIFIKLFFAPEKADFPGEDLYMKYCKETNLSGAFPNVPKGYRPWRLEQVPKRSLCPWHRFLCRSCVARVASLHPRVRIPWWPSGSNGELPSPTTVVGLKKQRENMLRDIVIIECDYERRKMCFLVRREIEKLSQFFQEIKVRRSIRIRAETRCSWRSPSTKLWFLSYH